MFSSSFESTIETAFVDHRRYYHHQKSYYCTEEKKSSSSRRRKSLGEVRATTLGERAREGEKEGRKEGSRECLIKSILIIIIRLDFL